MEVIKIKRGYKKIKKVREILKLRNKIIIGSIIGGLIFLIISIIIVASTLFSMSGILSNILFDRNIQENVNETDIDCMCGCVWVAGNGNSVTIQTPVGTDETGNSLSELKLLGTAEMSYYNQGSSTTFDTDTGIPITSSGAFATSGITIAIHPDTRKDLGLEIGDWVYIENIGVRQLQDICGIAGRVDVYVDMEKDSDVISNNMKELKIYFIESGTITKGLQDNVIAPVVSVTSTDVPSYGYGTGSITNTSKQLPTFKFGQQSENVINAFLVGSVVSYQVYGIYPSVMIGQKIQESGYSITSTIPNNFYGIKADPSWTGDKGLYWTTENIDGVDVSVQDWFRHYDTFEEGVLAHGEFLVDNERYAKAGVFDAKNGKEQIQCIKNAGYATDPNYVNKVVNVMESNSLLWFDDISNSIYYMQQKGLYESYANLISKIKSGDVVLHEKADLSKLGEINIGSTENTSGGHWVCACAKPCPYCHCHDNEVEGDKNTGSGTSSVFPAEQAGQASGLFGTTEELKNWINSLNDSNKPIGADVEQLKANMLALLPYIGMMPADMFEYKTDKFTGPDGYGFIHYNQSSSSNEPYLNLHHQDGTTSGGTFRSSACGIYSLAMCYSTLEKKWVNPAEVAIALQNWGARNNKSINTTQMGSLGAAYWDALYQLTIEAGYTSSQLDNKKIEQDKLDACLDAGGLVMIVTTGLDYSTSGHYIVIREKTSDGNYLLGDSAWQNNNTYSFTRIYNSAKPTGTLYIYPKQGQSIKDRLENANNSNNGSTGTIQSNGVAKVLDNLDMSSDMFRNNGAFHGAIDYRCPIGTPVYAMWDGVVSTVTFGFDDDMNGADGGGYGNHIIITNTNGTKTVYAHMTNSGLMVNVGDIVKAGQQIGKSGNSGSSDGAHLHVEVRVSETPRIVVSYKKLLEGYQLNELAQRLYVLDKDKVGHGSLIQAGVE